MNLDCERAASFIDSLDQAKQTAFLARLIYELTLAGRACYSIESNGLDRPSQMREINELQHRLAAQIMNIHSGGLFIRSSLDLAALFLEPNDRDESLYREVRRSFIDAVRSMIPAAPSVLN